MATDRLAALRAQGGGSNTSYNSGGGYGGGGGGGGDGGGYQSRRPNPYARQDDTDNNRYEMSSYNTPSNGYNAPAPASGGAGDMNAFWSEVSSVQDEIKAYNDSVTRISELHARSLNNMDDQALTRQLDQAIAETRKMANELKKRIKSLQAQGGNSREGQTRRQQATLLKEKFQAAIQNYQQVEQKHRQAHKQRMERQFKIVKPDATPDEVRAVVNDESGGQIFQQALMNSNRYGAASQAYQEVQERQQDIRRIEETIAELAQLFNDMAILVEEQGETINVIEQTTMAVEKDTEQGFQHTVQAKSSAMSARKKRWICFVIVIIIIIIVVVVVLVQVLPKINTGGGNNGGTQSTVTESAPPQTSAATPSARRLR